MLTDCYGHNFYHTSGCSYDNIGIIQWCGQPQFDARAHIFSIQLFIQVITTITPVYIATFIVSYVHSLIFVVLKKCTARLN